MVDSNSPQSDSPPFSLLATSILGIKGPLRIRPHGSAAKPHIILRRVTVSEDSSEDGEPDNTVRFSLFAAKRIEVKPGRELLLTVASPDGFFQEKAVVFEADLTGDEEISDEKSYTQAPDEEVYLPPAGEAIPPKMRRAWTKKAEEVSSGTQEPAVTRSSVGVQAEPAYASISTQAQPTCTQVSVQTHSNCVSTAIQVDLPHISTQVQTEDDRRYMSLEVQTDAPTTGLNSWNDRHHPNTRRSPSPMDLGNTPYSQKYHSSSCTPPLYEGLYSPTQWAPYSPANNSWTPPRHTWRQPSPPPPPSPPNNSWSPRSNQWEKSPYSLFNPNRADTPTWSPSHFPYTTSPPSRPSSTPEIHDQVAAEVSENRDSDHPLSSTQSASITAVDDLPNPNTNLKPHSRESQSSSHFVSAGVLTVFDGSVNENPTLPQSDTNGAHAGKVNTTSSAVNPKPKLASSVPGVIHSNPSAPIPTQPSSLRSKGSKSTPAKPSPSQNAVASSSKVLLDRIAPHSQHPPQQSTLNGTRPVTSLSSRALEKTPASPASQTHPTAKRLSPIPDPKNIAYIPSGPSSNPLNIKPSSCAVPRVTVPPRAPRALARYLVGPGWPNVKVINTVNDNTNPPTPTQPPPPLPLPGSHAVKTTDLSTIISYSSPPPSPSTPGCKWKRVAGAAPPAATDGSCAIQPSPMTVDDQIKTEKPITVAQDGSQISSLVVMDSKKPLVSLRDRIGPAASHSQSQPTPTEKPTKATVNGPERNLLSRISDVPISSQTPMVSTEDRVKKVEKPPSTPSTSQPATPVVTPAPLSTIPQSLVHPLPPKPVLAVSAAPGRGVKRDRPTSPAVAELTKRRKRNLRWPTVDCNFSVGLKGDGELAVRSISFSSDGGHFALSLSDRSIRIWNNRDRNEIAKLMHNCLVVSVLWMDGDSGIISLGEDGLVSKWTRNGNNRWQWAKVLDARNNDQQEDDQICFAYHRDRIAVSFPRTGVKVWMWMKGTWQQCRGILRQNVSSLRFVEDGEALLGGTRDGVLWYCEVPNGTLRAYAFLKATITSLDLNPAGTHVLVSQTGGFARLLSIRQTNKGSVELSYSCKETEARPNIGFGAVFATQGQAVLFGSVEGCVLVWDRKKGAIVYGLAHEEGDVIQAVASFDGSLNKEGCLLTGTSTGHLAWWSQPVADANITNEQGQANAWSLELEVLERLNVEEQVDCDLD